MTSFKWYLMAGVGVVALVIYIFLHASSRNTRCTGGRGTTSLYSADCPWRVAYVHSGWLRILLDQKSGWDCRVFSPSANAFAYAISADGRTIAYASVLRDGAGWRHAITVEDVANRTTATVSGEYEAQAIAFSPSGRCIAFLGLEGSLLNGYGREGLFIWDRHSGDVSLVTQDVRPLAFGVRPNSLSWCGEDSLAIESASSEVVLLSRAQSDWARRVLVVGQSPAVAPNGRWLCYSREGMVRLRSLDGMLERDLFRVCQEWDSGVSWSSDSQYIAYVRTLDGGSGHGIFMMRVTGGGEMFITEVDGWQRFLCLVDVGWLKYFSPRGAARAVQ